MNRFLMFAACSAVVYALIHNAPPEAPVADPYPGPTVTAACQRAYDASVKETDKLFHAYAAKYPSGQFDPLKLNHPISVAEANQYIAIDREYLRDTAAAGERVGYNEECKQQKIAYDE